MNEKLKNKFFFIYLIFVISLSSGLKAQPFHYVIDFKKDTVKINESTLLFITFYYNWKKDNLSIKKVYLPLSNRILDEGIGQTITIINDSLKEIKVAAKVRFLQTGTYVLNPIIVFYKLNDINKNLLLNTPEIVVIDYKNEWKNYLTPKVIISSTFFLLLFFYILQLLFRYIYLKKNNERKIKENDFFNGKRAIEEMEKLLLDKRINYKKNVNKLGIIIEHYLNNNKDLDSNRADELEANLKEINSLKNKKIVTYKEFERIYQAVYNLLAKV